jgi:hypothetical protein
VGADEKRHEVSEIELRGDPQTAGGGFWPAANGEVEVDRRAGALESQLEHHASLERRRITEHMRDARNEALEDDSLAQVGQVFASIGLVPQSLIECVLEG